MSEVVEEIEKITFSCPRCGHEHEITPGEEWDKESGCVECSDWSVCSDCGEWQPDGRMINHEFVCQGCLDDHWERCDHCGKWLNKEVDDLHNVSGQTWCSLCVDRYAYSCDRCGELCQNGEGVDVVDEDGNECSYGLCCEDNTWWCDRCETNHPDGQLCPREDEYWVKDYHSYRRFVIRNTKRTRTIGLEMEVGEGASTEEVRELWEGAGGTDFAHPEHDSSLEDDGVEFVGNPWGIWDHLEFIRKYFDFFEGLKRERASLSTAPCGCHTNFLRDSFTEEGVASMIVLGERFKDAMILFSHPEQRDERFGYLNSTAIKIACKDDISKAARDTGSHATVTITKGQRLEVRLAGMTLDTLRFLAQVQMWHNAASWANTHAITEAATADFEDVFLPILFQSSVRDVIEKGRTIGAVTFMSAEEFRKEKEEKERREREEYEQRREAMRRIEEAREAARARQVERQVIEAYPQDILDEFASPLDREEVARLSQAIHAGSVNFISNPSATYREPRLRIDEDLYTVVLDPASTMSDQLLMLHGGVIREGDHFGVPCSRTSFVTEHMIGMRVEDFPDHVFVRHRSKVGQYFNEMLREGWVIVNFDAHLGDWSIQNDFQIHGFGGQVDCLLWLGQSNLFWVRVRGFNPYPDPSFNGRRDGTLRINNSRLCLRDSRVRSLIARAEIEEIAEDLNQVRLSPAQLEARRIIDSHFVACRGGFAGMRGVVFERDLDTPYPIPEYDWNTIPFGGTVKYGSVYRLDNRIMIVESGVPLPEGICLLSGNQEVIVTIDGTYHKIKINSDGIAVAMERI